MKLTKQLKQQWIDALKSGKYIQTKAYLRNEKNEFCCLDVFCEIAKIKHDGKVAFSNGQPDQYGPISSILGQENTSDLWCLNDDTFDEKNPNYENVISFIEKLETID